MGISQMNLQPLGLTQGGDDNASFTTTPWTELKEEKNRLQPLGLTQGGDDNANFTTTPWTELKEEKKRL